MSFKITEKEQERAYILDATPSYKLWKVSEGDFWKARNSGLRDVYIDYINSKIPLKDYDGSYEIAELVIARDIPFSRIKLEKIVKPSYYKYYSLD